MKRVLSALSLALLAIAAAAQTSTPAITQLFGFPCDAATLTQCPDGNFLGGFFESADGNFYGIASEGGTGMNSQGTVFKLTKDGAFTLLYSFAELPDGTLPFGASPDTLVEGLDGFLYGTTLVDGTGGAGTAFKMSKTGTITLLHNFCTTLTCGDGANPSFLTLGLDGNFYGGTGPNNPPTSVLFRMSPSGGFKVLHTFDLKTQPDGLGIFGMVPAPDGKFYGTTVAGDQLKPWNSVFRFDPVTSQYTILHGFNSPNINLPNVGASAPILASDGNLYGLRVGSILYRVTLSGQYHELGPMSPTQFIDGDVMQASDGTLWGTFFDGTGVLFNSTLSDTVLKNLTLDPSVNGSGPFGVLQAADGKLYGMSAGSGAPTNGQPSNGTFWVIDAGLPAPAPNIINFQPTSGKASSTFLLQGNHFVGATQVTINGKSANFKVLTANYIRVAVPAGAATGKISVTNAGGTSTSTKAFTVQ
jgi:uncharacterized repeat protein (TIGR03803 family)